MDQIVIGLSVLLVCNVLTSWAYFHIGWGTIRERCSDKAKIDDIYKSLFKRHKNQEVEAEVIEICSDAELVKRLFKRAMVQRWISLLIFLMIVARAVLTSNWF